MKVKIERLSRKTIDTKYGKKEKLGIFDGEKWYGTFVNQDCKDWKEGDTVEGTIVSREWQDKTYYDIKPISQMELRVRNLETNMAAVKDLIKGLDKPTGTATKPPEMPQGEVIADDPPPEVYLDDVPF